MITELLGLAGSGIAGSIFGMLSDWRQEASERKRMELELKIKQEDRLNARISEHVKDKLTPAGFGVAFGMLVATYCACTILCFVFPEIPVWTFNPDEEPKKVDLLWGLIKWERQVNYVYTLSTSGVGFSLLHPLAFMIGSVITGINPSKR